MTTTDQPTQTHQPSDLAADNNKKGSEGRSHLRIALIALVAVGLGVGLGIILSMSTDMAYLAITLIVFLLLGILIFWNPFYGLIIWIFFNPFVESWISISLGTGVPDLSFSRYIIIVLFVAMFFKTLKGSFRFLPVSVTDLLVLFIPIFLLLSFSRSTDPRGAVNQIAMLFFVPLAGYFFARHLVRSEEQLNQLLLAMVIFGLAAGAYAIFEATTGNILFLERGQTVERFFRGNTSIRLIQGLLGETGAMGRALAITILISLYFYMKSESAESRMFFLVVIAIQGIGLLLTFSRSPVLGLVAGMMVLAIFIPRFRKQFLIFGMIAVIVLSIGWGRFQGSEVAVDRISRGTQDYYGRTNRWQTGLRMWQEKPFLGWGYGRYQEESGEFRTDNRWGDIYAIESDYLFTLLGSGLVGLLPYLAFLAIPFVKSLRLYSQARSPDWPGFILPETIVVYWAVLICLLIFSISARIGSPMIRLLPFAMFGAVIGTHEHFAKRTRRLSPQQNSTTIN